MRARLKKPTIIHMKLSLIIPTLNRPKSLDDCFHSISLCGVKPDEIIVVDQSDDEDIAKDNEMVCRTLVSAKRIVADYKSITRARNIGMEHASGDIFIFSDDDVTFPANFFENVSKLFSDNKLGLLGTFNSLDCKSKRGLRLSAHIFDFREHFHKEPGYITKSMLGVLPPQKAGSVQTTWAMGYCFCIRRSITEAHGLTFDENMRGYAFNEDLDFTMRYCRAAKDDGYRCEYNGNVWVEHHVSQEYRTPSLIFYLAWLGNRYYMLKKERKTKNNFYVWLTYVGILSRLKLHHDRFAIQNLKKAHKIIKGSLDAIQNGNLDYANILEAQIDE